MSSLTIEEFSGAVSLMPEHYRRLPWHAVQFCQHRDSLVAVSSQYNPLVFEGGVWRELFSEKPNDR